MLSNVVIIKSTMKTKSIPMKDFKMAIFSFFSLWIDVGKRDFGITEFQKIKICG